MLVLMQNTCVSTSAGSLLWGSICAKMILMFGICYFLPPTVSSDILASSILHQTSFGTAIMKYSHYHCLFREGKSQILQFRRAVLVLYSFRGTGHKLCHSGRIPRRTLFQRGKIVPPQNKSHKSFPIRVRVLLHYKLQGLCRLNDGVNVHQYHQDSTLYMIFNYLRKAPPRWLCTSRWDSENFCSLKFTTKKCIYCVLKYMRIAQEQMQRKAFPPTHQ